VSQPAAEIPVVEIHGLRKSFGGTAALRGVDLTVAAGEVHGLLGENGSGKSTLIKILAGYHAPDGGSLHVNGAPVPLPLRPGESARMGLSFMHQDLGLIPTRTVVENLKLGEFARRLSWHISWRGLCREAQHSFARYGLAIDPRALVDDLSPTEQAMLAVVRAVEDLRAARRDEDVSTGLLVLDEPTVALPEDGIARLFALMREVARQGMGVLFVSHDLEEVSRITDEVTVLRNGEVCGQVTTSETSVDDLAAMIVGRRVQRVRLAGSEAQLRARSQAPAVRIKGLCGRRLETLSLDLYPGEVVGVTGLAGSGCEEILELIYGATQAQQGTIEIGAERFAAQRMTPPHALAAGIALIPANRLRDGAVSSLSLTDNMTLAILPAFRGPLGLRRGAIKDQAQELANTFGVQPQRTELPFEAFSGGNQQKAVLAKWLAVGPRLLLVHEPTQGVDIGARQEIFKLIRSTAAAGTAVICASLDYEQLVALCERVLVIGDGRVTADLADSELTKDRIANEVYTSTSVQALEG
jgi:ribose transport system ATP-binding protein